MRVAFYAPMKPPDDPVPSGDRTMARLMTAALRQAGHTVSLESRFRSRDGAGDPARQARLAALGGKMAARLVRRLRPRPPEAWFTYHVYHKAPDWIGPAVCRALRIPYVVAEASVAGKRADGPWATGYAGAAAAIRAADAVIGLNSRDRPGVVRLTGRDDRVHHIRPFTDIAPYAAAAAQRDRHRAALAARHGLASDRPWLLAVAMMRPGDKLDSYRVLAAALAGLGGAPWQLLVVGDGPARPAVEALLAPLGPDRVRWAGLQPADGLAACYAAADVLVWPAVREAYGLAILEAQAAGLPVVAGDAGGVPDIVRDGITGRLAAEGDAAAFAAAVGDMLYLPAARTAMRRAALEITARDHAIAGAAARIDSILHAVARVPA